MPSTLRLDVCKMVSFLVIYRLIFLFENTFSCPWLVCAKLVSWCPQSSSGKRKFGVQQWPLMEWQRRLALKTLDLESRKLGDLSPLSLIVFFQVQLGFSPLTPTCSNLHRCEYLPSLAWKGTAKNSVSVSSGLPVNYHICMKWRSAVPGANLLPAYEICQALTVG